MSVFFSKNIVLSNSNSDLALEYIGFLKFLELRQKAMEALGDKFDLKAFHNIILVNGSVPLTLLEQLVDEFITGVA